MGLLGYGEGRCGHKAILGSRITVQIVVMAENAGSAGLVSDRWVVVDISSFMRSHRIAWVERVLVAGCAQVGQTRGTERIQGRETHRSTLGAHRLEMGGQRPQDEVFTDEKDIRGGAMRIMALDAK